MLKRRADQRRNAKKLRNRRIGFRCQIEQLESRRLLASASAPATLQWFDGSFATIENRTADIFNAGYGSVWVPPPGRADSGGFSVGYDVYNYFDLGGPDTPTLYGSETGLKEVASTFDNASIALHVDAVLNHAGFSDLGTPGFAASGGYPGYAITLPNAIDGDFHSGFESGDLNGRLAGLVDVDHTTNHVLIRNPVDPAASNNIPAGTTPAFGRLANVPTEENLRFYPDRDLDPIILFDPVTGEMGIEVYPFNPDCDSCGDPVAENALGYQMRYLQWMVQEIGVDGFRLDAAKHFEPFVLDFLDRAVYRSNPRLLLDGSVDNVFSYGEVFDGNTAFLNSFVKKNINSADPGTIGGNRDVLDFSAAFAMHDNLGTAGTSNAWVNVRDSLVDLQDDGIHNGSAGVLFVNSHDEQGPFELNNVAHAFMLMYPGNAVVYFNGKEFGDNRDFPKDGRGDALGGVFGDTIERLVQIRNTHGRGNFQERWISNDGLYVYERESSAVVGLSNRGDNGFDERTVTVAFAPGTHLIELTGNASDPTIDPFNDIPEVVTVSAAGTIDIRVPRNRNANGDFHGSGFVIYGLETPQAPAELEIIGSSQVLAGTVPAANNFDNGTTRLADVHVITADSFQARLQTNEVRLLGLESLRDIHADGDHALLRVDGGIDLNGNGQVDFVTPGDPSYGFEAFTDKSSPLIGPTGISGPRGDGEFLQTIDTTTLAEGTHFIQARAFRHRTDGGPSIYSDLRETFYVDRLPPVSAVASFEPFEAGVNENRDLVIESVDKTANGVHVFLNLPAATSDADILNMVGLGQGQARQIDRDQFIFGFTGITHGNNVATVVTFEQTGNSNIQRIPGLFTSTIVGAGLGDVDFDGDRDEDDRALMLNLVSQNNAVFNAAADFNADGLIDEADLLKFVEDFVDQQRIPADFGDAPSDFTRPYFTSDIPASVAADLTVPGGDVSIQDDTSIDLAGLSRDDTANDSLYFQFTANPTQIASGTMLNAFAGLQLFNDDVEGIGIGSRFDTALWSYFGSESGDLNSSNADSGSNETIAEGVQRTIWMKVQYVAGGDDTITVWMEPDDVLDNVQSGASTTSFTADASFDEVRLRLGSDAGAVDWSFSNVNVVRQLKPGAAHLIAGPRLGLLVDPDGGLQASVDASGDDLNGADDEDGVSFGLIATDLALAGVNIELENATAAKVDAWIDFNQDGDWDDPNEKILDSVDVVGGLQTLNYSVPAGALPGDTFARVRVSTAGGLDAYEPAIDGEAEDYRVTVSPPPKVTEVRVGSTFWNQAFRDAVDTQGQGVLLSSGAGQLTDVPYVNANQLFIEFDQPVFAAGGAALQPSQFQVIGSPTSNKNYQIDTVTVDAMSNTAILTLNQVVSSDKLLIHIADGAIENTHGIAFDGEWATGNLGSSGDNAEGGAFNFRFDVLPGNVNDDPLTNTTDLSVVRSLGTQIAGALNFNPRANINGDFLVSTTDLSVLRSLGTQFLIGLDDPIPPA